MLNLSDKILCDNSQDRVESRGATYFAIDDSIVLLCQTPFSQHLYRIPTDFVDYYKSTHSLKLSFNATSSYFASIGDVELINKEGKNVKLKNGYTISYKYLVLVSLPHECTSEQEKEKMLSSGLQALIDIMFPTEQKPPSFSTRYWNASIFSIDKLSVTSVTPTPKFRKAIANIAGETLKKKEKTANIPPLQEGAIVFY